MKLYALLGLIVVLLYAKFIIPQVVEQTKASVSPDLLNHKSGLYFAVGMSLTFIWILWPVAAFFLVLHLRYRHRRQP